MITENPAWSKTDRILNLLGQGERNEMSIFSFLLDILNHVHMSEELLKASKPIIIMNTGVLSSLKRGEGETPQFGKQKFLKANF